MVEQPLFSLYAAIVKNLRGVVVFNELSEAVLKRVSWLRKRFRYRDLGLPPRLLEKFRESLKEYLGGKPFRELYYPIEKYRALPKLLEEYLGFNELVSEALMLSSLYISPLLVLDDLVIRELSEVAASAILVNRDMGINDWKLHLRIADYTVLDMYSFSVETGLRALKCYAEGEKDCLEETLAKRQEAVEKDKKRYWRIRSEKGRVFMLYIDPLKLLVERGVEPRAIDLDYAAGLAIIPCINVNPELAST